MAAVSELNFAACSARARRTSEMISSSRVSECFIADPFDHTVNSSMDRLQLQARDEVSRGFLWCGPNHHLPLPQGLWKKGEAHVFGHDWNDRFAQTHSGAKFKEKVGRLCCFGSDERDDKIALPKRLLDGCLKRLTGRNPVGV